MVSGVAKMKKKKKFCTEMGNGWPLGERTYLGTEIARKEWKKKKKRIKQRQKQ